MKCPFLMMISLKRCYQISAALCCCIITSNTAECGSGNFSRTAKSESEYDCKAVTGWKEETVISTAAAEQHTSIIETKIYLAGTLVFSDKPEKIVIRDAKISRLENGVEQSIVCPPRMMLDAESGSTTVIDSASGKQVQPETAAALAMIISLPRGLNGETVYGSPGTIKIGDHWTPNLQLLAAAYRSAIAKPEHLSGTAEFVSTDNIGGIMCMCIRVTFIASAANKLLKSVINAYFPIDELRYGPLHLDIQAELEQTAASSSVPLAVGMNIKNCKFFSQKISIKPN